MLPITLSDIPAYMRTGAFYKSLHLNNGNEVIQVPEGCFKADTSIANADDFKALLDTVMYWGVDDLLPVFLDYCCANEPSVCSAAISGVAESELRSDLLLVSEELHSTRGPLDAAISQGRTNLVKYFCDDTTISRDQKPVHTAVNRGQLDSLKLLNESGFPVTPLAFQIAAENGHLDCLKYVYGVLERQKRKRDESETEGGMDDKRVNQDEGEGETEDENEGEDESESEADDGEDGSNNGSEGGSEGEDEDGGSDNEEDSDNDDEDGGEEDEDDRMWRGVNIEELTESVAQRGHADVLEFLLQHFEGQCSERAAACAVSEGRTDCLKVLSAFDQVFGDVLQSYDDTVYELGVLRCLVEDCGMDLPASMALRSVADTELLRYVMEHGGEYDAGEILDAVLEGDHVNTLKYLVEELRLPTAESIEEGVRQNPKCEACKIYLQAAGLLTV